MSGAVENRRSTRQTLRIPVKLEVLEANNSAAKIFLGYTSNISPHGLAINIPSKAVLNLSAQILIYIDGQNAFSPSKVAAKISWRVDAQCGLEFLPGHDSIQDLLRTAGASLDVQGSFLKKLYPFVGGENVDTRNYEFFPYAEKFVTEHAKTRDLSLQLKQGNIPPETASYFYAQVAVADSDLNSAAIFSAHRAFHDFRKLSVKKRRKILDDVRDLLLKEKRNLIELLVIEGHSLKWAEKEYESLLNCISPKCLNHFEKEMMETLAARGGETMIGIRRPHGVVCVSPPRNLSSVAFMACLSLLAGNTLVLKPPHSMPMSSIYLWKNILGAALLANGAPKGTMNIVLGDSRLFIQEWMRSPHVKCIFYFDENDGTLNASDKHILKSTGDSMLVWKDAPLEQVTEAMLDCLRASQQNRTAQKRILIHEEIYPSFVALLLKKILKYKAEAARDTEAVLFPLAGEISEFFEILNDALQNRAILLSGGYRVNHLGEKDAEGLFIAPTALALPIENADSARCVSEESSFPLLPILKVAGHGFNSHEKDESVYNQMMSFLERAADNGRVSIWAQDSHYLRNFIDDLNFSGSLRVNSRHMNSFPNVPAGGLFEEMNQVWRKASRLQWISITKIDEEEAQMRFTVSEG